jgi:hypothetical protein
VSQIIQFQYPEVPDSIYCMFVADEALTAALIRRVEALGYTIVDVSPPMARWVPQRSASQTAARR